MTAVPPSGRTPLCITNGWYWYCDVHDSHGVADEKAEAEAIAEAHVTFKMEVEQQSPGDECCDIAVWAVGIQGLAP